MGEQNKQAWSNEWAHVNQYNNQAVSIFILYITIQTGINVKSDYPSVYDIDFDMIVKFYFGSSRSNVIPKNEYRFLCCIVSKNNKLYLT